PWVHVLPPLRPRGSSEYTASVGEVKKTRRLRATDFGRQEKELSEPFPKPEARSLKPSSSSELDEASELEESPERRQRGRSQRGSEVLVLTEDDARVEDVVDFDSRLEFQTAHVKHPLEIQVQLIPPLQVLAAGWDQLNRDDLVATAGEEAGWHRPEDVQRSGPAGEVWRSISGNAKRVKV